MRIHPLWRITAYLALAALLTAAGSAAAAFLGRPAQFWPPFLGITAATWLVRRYLERKSLAGLGLTWRPRHAADIALGLLLPVVLFSFIFAAEWGAGWLLVAEIAPVSGWALLRALAGFAAVAWYEELLVRGYLLGTAAGAIGPVWANLLTALFFGGLHALNPSASPLAVAGVSLAGLFLGQCRLATGALYLPMAFHFSWNAVQALLGFPVSGVRFPGLFRLLREGPSLYTGGHFGPEAGLLGSFAIAAAAACVWAYAKRSARAQAGETSPRSL